MRKERLMRVLSIILICLAVLTPAVLAVDTSWTNGAGDQDWLNAGNWDLGVPTIADRVFIADVVTGGPVINTPDPNCGYMEVRGQGTGKLTIAAGGKLLVEKGTQNGQLYIGNAGAGELDLTGGTLIMKGTTTSTFKDNNHIFVGNDTSPGILRVGSGSYVQPWDQLLIGNIADSNGLVIVDGGTIDYTMTGGQRLHTFYLGNQTGSYGRVVLNSGEILMGPGDNGGFTVGKSGTGYFEVNGGLAQMSGTRNLRVGNNVGSDGHIIVNGGRFETTMITTLGGVQDDGAATGELIVTGGEVYIDSTLRVAWGADSTGTISMTGGTLETEGDLMVGGNGCKGDATLTIDGDGYAKCNGTIYIGPGDSITVNDGMIKWYGSGPVFEDDFIQTPGKIYFNGGTLRWDGNHVQDFSDLMATGNIVVGSGVLDIYFRPDREPGSDDDDTYAVLQAYLPGQATDDYPAPYQVFDIGAFFGQPNITLSWVAGAGAVSHNVYIGTDYDAVLNATTASPEYQGNVGGTTFVTTSPNPGDVVFWRIDEVQGDASVIAGYVWQYSMRDTLWLGNFEVDLEGWQASGTATVSRYEEPASGDFLTLDAASMQFDYANVNAGDKGETYLALSGGEGDWNEGSLAKLVINWHGTPYNGFQDLYAKITTTGGSVTIPWDGDPNISQYLWEGGFNTWYIDLTSLAGVNLDAVTELRIGVAPGANEPNDGTIYFDNIYVTLPTCVPSKVAGDFDGDCTADMDDFALLAEDWKFTASTVNAAGTEPTDYVVYYSFDAGTTETDPENLSGTAYDILHPTDPAFAAVFIQDGNTGDGEIEGQQSFVTGGINGTQCLMLDDSDANNDGDGEGLGLQVLSPEVGTLGDEVTISVWCNGDIALVPGDTMLFVSWDDTSGEAVHLLRTTGPNPSGAYLFQAGPGTWYEGDYVVGYTAQHVNEAAGKWNHLAFTKASNGVQRMYLNGVIVAERLDNFQSLTGINNFAIGGRPGTFDGVDSYERNADSWAYSGLIDDFKVYDRALSHAEVVRLALGPAGSVNQPVLTDADADGNGVVDMADLSEMLNIWLTDVVWP